MPEGDVRENEKYIRWTGALDEAGVERFVRAGGAEKGGRGHEYHPVLTFGWLGTELAGELAQLRLEFADAGAVSGRQATPGRLVIEGANAVVNIEPRGRLFGLDLTFESVAKLNRYTIGREYRIPFIVGESRGVMFAYQTPLIGGVIENGIVTGTCPFNGLTGTQRAVADDGAIAVYSSGYRNNRSDRFGGVRRAGCGKIAQIKRPYAVDHATGDVIWGHLELDAGELTMVFDRADFVDRIGPITIDPDVGYTSIGGSSNSSSTARHYSDDLIAMPEDGDATSVTIYSSGTADWTLGIHSEHGTPGQPGNTLRDTAGFTWSGSLEWHTENLDSSVSIASGAVVSNGFDRNSTGAWYYDGTAGYSVWWETRTYSSGTLPNFSSPLEVLTNTRISIYFSYTASGGGGGDGTDFPWARAAIPIARVSGLAPF